MVAIVWLLALWAGCATAWAWLLRRWWREATGYLVLATRELEQARAENLRLRQGGRS